MDGRIRGFMVVSSADLLLKDDVAKRCKDFHCEHLTVAVTDSAERDRCARIPHVDEAFVMCKDMCKEERIEAYVKAWQKHKFDVLFLRQSVVRAPEYDDLTSRLPFVHEFVTVDDA